MLNINVHIAYVHEGMDEPVEEGEHQETQTLQEINNTTVIDS